MTELNLQPNVAESLKHWHEMIRTGNLSALPELLDPKPCSARRWRTRLTPARQWCR